MSHEHEGVGGYLDFHNQEMKRLVKEGGFRNESSASIPAWNNPSGDRRRLINTVLQLNCAFIFCFRAKEKIKPKTGGSPIQLGWQAIAGEEFGFEMTVRCLLQPGAKGVPDWSSEAQKLGVPKRIKDHEDIFLNGVQLDESIGERLAKWASGGSEKKANPKAIDPPAQQKTDPSAKTIDLQTRAHEAAMNGMEAFKEFWSGLSSPEQKLIVDLKEELKSVAADVDKEKAK